jgi:hypothetical protein
MRDSLAITHVANIPLPYIYPLSQSTGSCYACERYVVHRHEANYVQVVHVDDLDYDYEDYFRFWRVEKQLTN